MGFEQALPPGGLPFPFTLSSLLLGELSLVSKKGQRRLKRSQGKEQRERSSLGRSDLKSLADQRWERSLSFCPRVNTLASQLHVGDEERPSAAFPAGCHGEVFALVCRAGKG